MQSVSKCNVKKGKCHFDGVPMTDGLLMTASSFGCQPSTDMQSVSKCNVKKGKGFPYSTPSVGPGADPGV